MNYLTQFSEQHSEGECLVVTTAAQGISLALMRAPTARRQALLNIGKDVCATEALIASLLNKIQEGTLPSQGDVAAWLCGYKIIM